MTADQPDLHTLTGAYAVDALPDDEREIFEHHLLVCDPCAQEVVELQATASRLADGIDTTLPPALRQRVLDEIDATRQERPRGAQDETATDELSRRRNRRVSPWITGIGAVAAAVILVAGFGVATTITDLNDRISEVETASSQMSDVLAAPDAVTIEAAGPDGAMGRVVASPTRGEAVFVAADLEPLPDDRIYELWLIDDTANPAGLFAPDDRGRATRIMTGDIANAAAIGVTVEPAGGSPAPTTDPIMVFELLEG
ncbi:MAG: anti-sigma factor [Nitriliruptoraceae bacterium]|nr:anti-sigma factor [Nitriliruptoraceae bacterium]